MAHEGFEGTHLLRCLRLRYVRSTVAAAQDRSSPVSLGAAARALEQRRDDEIVLVPFFRLVRFLTQREIRAKGGGRSAGGPTVTRYALSEFWAYLSEHMASWLLT